MIASLSATPWFLLARGSVRRKGFSTSTRELRLERKIPFHRLDVFKVVVDVSQYPEFLPFCTDSNVKSYGHNQMRAVVKFQHRMFEETIHYNISWQTPSKVLSVAENTKFAREIIYKWKFEEFGEKMTLAKLSLRIDFNSSSTALLFDMFSDQVQENVLRAFCNRVEELQHP